MSTANAATIDRRGTWWQRVLIWLFSVILTLLVYWLLGFVLDDIGRLPGPDWAELEAAQIDPVLKATDVQLEQSIVEVNRQIENQRRRQQLLRESTTSSQTTLNQLLELLRVSIEQNATLPDEQQQALTDSQRLFLENQKEDQEYNESLSSLQEELATLQERQRTHREVLEKARQPVNVEFYRLQRQHDWRVAAIKIGFLTPLLLVGGFLFALHRNGKYAPMIYALDAALLGKGFVVMHQYFPREYFKYVIIFSSLAVIGMLLARLLKMVSEPGRETRLKQAREAYESFQCPVCQFPIRRGPFKYMSWSPRSLRKTSRPIVNAPDEAYTCPSCSTILYEKCTCCGAVRHGLLPACEHCGVEKEV
jgi:hypothetical protein